MDLVYNFLDTLSINENDNIIVAVSYGPDSMALLDIIKNHFNNKIICAHVHHNHRKESDEEARLLEDYCNKNNIVFEMMKIEEYKNNKFTEEEARNKRYIFFDELVQKYNSKYLFTAHHGDDLVETVLMKLVRGSSVKGYSGIKLLSKRNNYNLVRPLIYLTKEDIINYCSLKNIKYAVDKSNSDDEYTRNRFRNHVLPMLKEENINVHKQFLKFSTALQEYDEYIDEVINSIYKKINKNNILDLKLLLDEKDIIIKKILMRFLYEKYDNKITLINESHILLIMNMIKNNKSTDKISLPNKINLIKSYNKIYFDKDLIYNNYCFMFEDYLELPNGYIIKQVETLENTTNYVTAFNKEDISFPLYVRGRLDGDKIEVLGMDGKKKIKDIFIDEKIDLSVRNNYPVLVDSKGKILWLPGLKKSKYDKSKTKKYDIIFKYYKEE